MPCKYLNSDLAVVVRCEFTDNRVCQEWIDEDHHLNGPYVFCERQVRNFKPTPVGDAEGSNDE
jgi:hypothetical protein